MNARKAQNIRDAADDRRARLPDVTPPSSAEIAAAAAVLRRGGLVAMPTETVYGLAANAFDAQAVARVFEAKRRPQFDPLIVHVADPSELPRVATDLSSAARRLVERFWPGPLTLVLPKRPEVPDLVTSGLPTVAVRMPDHPVALALIRAADTPLAAPSANPFGYISPTTAEHVRNQLGNLVDAILDGGPCRVGVESTILGWHAGAPVLLRAGGLPVEELERELGPIRRATSPEEALRPEAPGQLAQHYAPHTPVRRIADGGVLPTERRLGWIGLRAPIDPSRFAAVEALSPQGDLREAAAALFAALHRLDALGLDAILAEPVPELGLGVAINDRLRRASQRG